MNKDMMNIDDFVREKLNGHSEPENPAAWLKMKALLDEEMPERAVPFYFRLGKPVAFLGAALLIGALCVGGYQLQLSALRDKGAATETQTTQNNPEFNSRNNNKHTAPNTPENNNTIAAENNTELKDNNTNNTPTTINTTSNQSHKTISKGHSTTKTSSTDKSIAATVDAQNTQRKTAEENVVASNSTNADTDINTQTAQNNQRNGSVAPKKQTTQANKQQQRLLASNAAVRNDVSRAKKTAAALKDKKAEGKSTTTDQSVALNDPAKDTRKDSINAITIITKEKISKDFPKRIIRTQDTLATTKVALPEPVAETKPSPIINTTIVSNVHPSKKLIREATAASKKANKLASQKEAQRQKNIFASTINNNQATVKAAKQKSPLARLLESLNLPQAVSDAKRDAHNAQFFAGFGLGGNYTLSANANNFVGLQFGPTGELVFNKHWSLFASLKYFNRSGGTKTVNDNYSKEISNNIVDSTKGATQYFTVKTDSTNRFFNFSTVHSFEMPLTLRYAFRKFYVMTGINIAYYLPINVEQIEKSLGVTSSHAVATNTTKPMLSETKPMLATNDFGSRFGLGYVLGAGYQITPAWQVDFRLVRTVWDNANGNGAQKLSSDFYRLPSVQMSVGYQFNRGRKKPTFGPANAP